MFNFSAVISRFVFVLLMTFPGLVFAQHCPWDCSGMIMIETDVPKDRVYRMQPILVDENKNVIADTIYGTESPAYDTCKLMFQDDFTALRTEKIKHHRWYQYDTAYHFASGLLITRINFCKNHTKTIYLRWVFPDDKKAMYYYKELPLESLIHLHSYNNELRKRENEKMRKDVDYAIVRMNCRDWKIREAECR